MKLLNRKLEKDLGQHNCYISLDELPIRLWFNIHKEADITKLLKADIKLSDKAILQLGNIWMNLYDSYIERFGLTDDFMADLRAEIKLANLQADYIITGEKYLITLIKIEKEKIKLYEKGEVEPIELESILATMSKYYGFKLSSRDLTVSEYYSYINNITDGKKN